MVNMALNSTYVSLLDKPATLSPKCGRAAGPLTEVEGGHCLRLIATAVIAALLILNPNPSKADMNLKLYAYNKLDWSSHLITGEGHPLINSDWGAYLDHLKGKRKTTGRSPATDLKIRRTEAYWQ